MASLMEELIHTLQDEMAAYENMLPVAEQKTQAIIDNHLEKVQEITEQEQETVAHIGALEQKRTRTIADIAVVLNKTAGELTLSALADLLDGQPEQQKELRRIHKEFTRLLHEVAEVNGRNKNLLEESLEMISYNMNLIQSTRMVPGNNYTRNAGQWDMTASQTGMFDAKQ